jgi:GT2 family glycosyltransferase
MVNFWNRDIIDDAGDGYTVLGWGFKAGEGKKVSAYTEDREIFSACGGAAIYRRSVFDQIGYFDEAFFAYLEDLDISYRARIFGYRNYFASTAVAYHKASATTGGKRSSFKTKLVPRNNIYLIYKNMPLPQLGLNLLPITAGILVKGVVFSLKGYPREYFASLLEGFTTLSRVKKVRFRKKHLKNYVRIEKDLVMGLWHMMRD